MRRSFLKLVVGSVLLCWTLGFVTVVAYVSTRSWTEADAREAGVFYVFEQLTTEPPKLRTKRLAELQPNFSTPFTLLSLEEVERRVGHPVRPGEPLHYEASIREEWYFLLFPEGQSALAAGPVHPAIPTKTGPMGGILMLTLVPVIAGLIALRIEREVTKVERATQALATGEFSARVDNPHGPTNELATTFNAMAERVERLIRSRDELVQAVSHELGSPLSRLRFHIELLQHSKDTDREERLHAMTRELDALDDLVAELLSYAQSDDMAFEVCRFEPARTLADLAELARLEVPAARQITVRVDLPTEATAHADQRLFQRAVENVLRNAVKHAASEVRLELSEEPTLLRVSVHDDGPGIPEDSREQVATPFFRLEADRSRKTGGVGLGLAIVSRILERHGGRLEIGNSPLGGALVTTLWPRSLDPSAEFSAPQTSAQRT